MPKLTTYQHDFQFLPTLTAQEMDVEISKFVKPIAERFVVVDQRVDWKSPSFARVELDVQSE